MDQCRSRLKLSENFQRHWSTRISGEIHMDQSLVHTFSWGTTYGPMVLKVLLKFPPTLVLVHGWLFPAKTMVGGSCHENVSIAMIWCSFFFSLSLSPSISLSRSISSFLNSYAASPTQDHKTSFRIPSLSVAGVAVACPETWAISGSDPTPSQLVSSTFCALFGRKRAEYCFQSAVSEKRTH